MLIITGPDSLSRIPSHMYNVISLNAVYSTYNSELISIIPSVFGSSRFWTSNLDVARQIIANPTWIKPSKFSAALL